MKASNEENAYQNTFDMEFQEDTRYVLIDGERISFHNGCRYEELLISDFPQLKDEVVLVRENNNLRELHHLVRDGATITWLTAEDRDARKALQRSICMLMNCALSHLEEAKKDLHISVQCAIRDCIYCDVSDHSLLTDDFLERLKAEMSALVEADLLLEKRSVTTSTAVRLFHDQKMYDKEKLFRYRLASRTNVYEMDGYIDYNYGYMANRTGILTGWEIFRYDDGFMLRLPKKDENKQPVPLVIDRKLFEIQKESELWASRIGFTDVGDLNDRIVTGGMTNLILTQEAYHEKQVAAIASEIASDPRRKIILIAGPSSSGKTTFSHRLSAQLSIYGMHPYPIAMDNYFLDRELTPRDENGDYNFECLEAIDIRLFQHDMSALLAGEKVSMPTFNFKSGKREYKGDQMQLKEGDLLVVEGIHGLNPTLAGSLPAENLYRIYISALTQLNIDSHNRIPTTDGRLIRRIVRDARTRGTKAEDTIAMWPSVRKGEKEYIFPYQESADVMFNSALLYELSVLKIYAQPLLFGIDPSSPHYPEANRLLKFLDYFVPVAPEGIPVNSLIREFIGGSCFDV